MNPNDINPVCANCGSGMSERPESWFCARCTEHSQYVGAIFADESAHPAFRDWVRDDPENIVGYEVIRYPYPEGEESVGTIAVYDADAEKYRIRTDLDEPFEHTERILDRDVLLEYLWSPDGLDDHRIPEKLRLGLRKR